MGMAEKNETEGRCPACRAPYDKDKIVGMDANFERVVANNANQKNKPPKAKPKTNEGKKDLSNVRVIQQKMAYVIGLPLSLADEDLLQHKEFLVSMVRSLRFPYLGRQAGLFNSLLMTAVVWGVVVSKIVSMTLHDVKSENHKDQVIMDAQAKKGGSEQNYYGFRKSLEQTVMHKQDVEKHYIQTDLIICEI